jgi:hypothetical protein
MRTTITAQYHKEWQKNNPILQAVLSVVCKNQCPQLSSYYSPGIASTTALTAVWMSLVPLHERYPFEHRCQARGGLTCMSPNISAPFGHAIQVFSGQIKTPLADPASHLPVHTLRIQFQCPSVPLLGASRSCRASLLPQPAGERTSRDS